MSVIPPEPYAKGRIVSSSPLVTIGGISEAAPLAVSSVAGDIIADRPVLHLLSPTWTIGRERAEKLARRISTANSAGANGQYLVLASNEVECLACQAAGVQSIVASGLMFLDERIWRPVPAPSSERPFDAVYSARLDRFKRHELAAAIDRLLLVYAPSLDPEGHSLERVRDLLPHAVFANDASGKYVYLDPEEMVVLYSQSHVGLCLSAVEGPMRTSMEYLLCGMPVVSTRSIGGRDRYFAGGYCRIVEDDPNAVLRAVEELKALKLDRLRIRDHIGQVIAFERHNFLLAMNQIIQTRFGVADLFPTMKPFIGSLARFEPVSSIRAGLMRSLAAA